MVGVFAQSIHSDLTDSGGTLDVSYSLDINSGLNSMNSIFVDVKETRKNHKRIEGKMSKLAAQATRDLRQIILDALGRAVAEKPFLWSRRRISPLRLPPILPMEISPPTWLWYPPGVSHGAPENCRGPLSYFEFSGTYFEKFEIAGRLHQLLFEPQVLCGRASGY